MGAQTGTEHGTTQVQNRVYLFRTSRPILTVSESYAVQQRTRVHILKFTNVQGEG